jgi:hypothetical protein
MTGNLVSYFYLFVVDVGLLDSFSWACSMFCFGFYLIIVSISACLL